MNYETFSPYVTSIEANPLFHLARVPLLDPLFYRAPAALKHHHAYTGGLAVHTKEVLDYGLAIGTQFPAFNRDLFITAALWHDYAKTVEYVEDYLPAFTQAAKDADVSDWKFGKLTPPPSSPPPVFTEWSDFEKQPVGEPHSTLPSPYVRRSSEESHIWTRATTPEATQGHTLTGAQWGYYHARQCGVLASDRDAVIHCILSHHGRKDWGSPVEPATLEATILHQSDLLSAHYGATKEVAP